MKVLLLFIIAFFCSVAVNAQASVKFIEDIQVTPGGYSGEKNTVEKIPSENTAIQINYSYTAGTIEKCAGLQFKYAQMLDTNVEAITNIKLYNFIDDWMDTRYRYGGTNRSGIDCSAFTDTLINDVYGINMPRTAKEQFEVCKKIFRDELQEGDLVFFNTMGGISHVGVYLGNSYFVHSSIHGVTINSLTDDYYNRKFICGGKILINN